MRVVVLVISILTLVLINTHSALAHVVVKPSEAGKASFQTFTMGVPNEKDNPAVGLRLVLPNGLSYVSPTVKPGWTIATQKEGTGEDAKVTEISWTAGTIPAGQRDDFTFSAQVPATPTSLVWKVYQTYQNGDVVSWDQDPAATLHATDEEKEKLEHEGKGPYSQTAVINDLAANEPVSDQKPAPIEKQSNSLPFYLSGLALIVSAAAFWKSMKK